MFVVNLDILGIETKVISVNRIIPIDDTAEAVCIPVCSDNIPTNTVPIGSHV